MFSALPRDRFEGFAESEVEGLCWPEGELLDRASGCWRSEMGSSFLLGKKSIIF